MLRGAGAMVALLLIAAAVAAAVIISTGDSTGVKLKEVGGDTVQQVVDELQQLVQDNTK